VSPRDEPAGPRLPVPARAALCLLTAATVVACQGAPEGDGSGSTEGTPVAEASSASASTPAPAQDTTPADSSGAQHFDVSQLGINYGAPGAPIQVVEFSDFGCPHCREFHEQTYPVLYRDYVQTGEVIWKYVPFVLGVFPNSLDAARAGQCAIEQGDFAPMRDQLFSHQQQWETVEADSALSLFVGYAEEAGLDAGQLRSCMQGGGGDAEEKIRRGIQVGRQVGVRGTPTFFIQGQKLQGDRPVSFFREIFDQVLDSAAAGGTN